MFRGLPKLLGVSFSTDQFTEQVAEYIRSEPRIVSVALYAVVTAGLFAWVGLGLIKSPKRVVAGTQSVR